MTTHPVHLHARRRAVTSESRQNVLDAVHVLTTMRRRAPSLREVALMVGLSKSTTAYHVNALQSDGLLASEFYRVGTLRLTDAGRAACREVVYL